MKDISKNLYIFDCFGVVVSDVSKIWMDKHFDQPTQDKIRADVYRKIDCGKIRFEDSFYLLADMCGMTKDQVRAEWNTCLWPLLDTISLISELRKHGAKVVLLSNASNDYISEIWQNYNLDGLFDRLFVSANYGCAKPDREFYEICLREMGGGFERVYFTDDNPKNLVGLESLGITPVLFTSAEQVKKDFGL